MDEKGTHRKKPKQKPMREHELNAHFNSLGLFFLLFFFSSFFLFFLFFFFFFFYFYFRRFSNCFVSFDLLFLINVYLFIPGFFFFFFFSFFLLPFCYLKLDLENLKIKAVRICLPACHHSRQSQLFSLSYEQCDLTFWVL